MPPVSINIQGTDETGDAHEHPPVCECLQSHSFVQRALER